MGSLLIVAIALCAVPSVFCSPWARGYRYPRRDEKHHEDATFKLLYTPAAKQQDQIVVCVHGCLPCVHTLE